MLSLTVKVTLLFKMISESSHNVGLFTVILIVPQNFNKKKIASLFSPNLQPLLFTAFLLYFQPLSDDSIQFPMCEVRNERERERERERLTHVEEVVNCLKQDFIQH